MKRGNSDSCTDYGLKTIATFVTAVNHDSFFDFY